MGKIKLVVFDLDGTVLDTLSDIRASINYVLALYGIPQASLDDVRRYVGHGFANALKAAVNEKGGKDFSADFPSMLAKLRHHYQENAMAETKKYPGMEELLNTLIQKGIRVGILTNKDDAVARKIIKFYYPDIDFSFVEGKKPSRALKPDAALTLSVLNEAGLSADEVVIVGDSEVDYETAKNIDAESFIVSYGFRTDKELKESGIKRTIGSVGELGNRLFELLFA